jgi:lipoprotein Spr
MKNLLFVSVALGVFSGTSISGSAQTSVNFMRMTDGVSAKNSTHFIQDIQINPGTSMPGNGTVITVPAKNNTGKGLDIENCSSLQFKYAQLMNREVESITNIELYHFVDEWWATRYRYGGTTKSGIDCSAYSSALLSKVYGIKSPRTARDIYSVCDKIDKENLQEGDLVFFNTRGGVSHVGVYLGNGYFTHASVGNGVTINNLDEKYYNRKFIGGGRINPNLKPGDENDTDQ